MSKTRLSTNRYHLKITRIFEKTPIIPAFLWHDQAIFVTLLKI